jgi:hypothetical protein
MATVFVRDKVTGRYRRRQDQVPPACNRGTRTPDEIRAWRREYAEGKPMVTIESLASKYGVSIGSMHKIVSYRSYRWITD